MAETSIEWTEKVWNPVRGCSMVSVGCEQCYAMKTAHRFSGPGGTYEGLTERGPKGPRWNGKIILAHAHLRDPLHWQTPRTIFVNSMSDLFHEDIPIEFLHQVFAVMALTQQHTYQILTKRPERMHAMLTEQKPYENFWALVEGHAQRIYADLYPDEDQESGVMWPAVHGPLPNVWLGVSVENQQAADARIRILLHTPTAVRWISAEPLLGPVDLSASLTIRAHPSPLDWVVVGGESGRGARPCEVAWIRSIVQQCRATGVACFVKQLGAKPIWTNPAAVSEYDEPWGDVRLEDKKGGAMEEWPNDLQVREWPT